MLLFCFVCIFNVVMQCSHGEANNVYFNKVYHCNELLHKMLRLIEFILRSISHHFLSVHYSLESYEKNIVYSQRPKGIHGLFYHSTPSIDALLFIFTEREKQMSKCLQSKSTIEMYILKICDNEMCTINIHCGLRERRLQVKWLYFNTYAILLRPQWILMIHISL